MIRTTLHRNVQIGALLAVAVFLDLGRVAAAQSPPTQQKTKPNIIFILTDDQGYGDVGALYQNDRPAGEPRMKTPYLDQLAAHGMTLTQHYCAAPVCAPSRASILMGMDQGHALLRDNQFDDPLPANYTLGTVMQAAGYYTAMVGKYGFGPSVSEPDSRYPACPLKRGFDTFFGFMSHVDAHSHYPGNHGGIFAGCKQDNHGLDGLYSADLFTAKAKQIIIGHEKAHPKQPFFLYLAYTMPHMEMTLPAGPYPHGLGIHGGDRWPLKRQTPNSYYWPAYKHKDWPDVEKRFATMIHRLDYGVGDVTQTLRDLGIANNTLVVFTSDNGPHNARGQDPRFFQSWGPYDGIKLDLFEGGEREPTFVVWPGHIAPGSQSDILSAQFDWMATFAQAAGLPAPARTDGVSLLPVLTGHPGKQKHHSYLYSEYRGKMWGPLTKTVLARHGYRRRGQEQAVHIGDFVGLRYNIHHPADPLKLYNVVKDPKQKHNLAHEQRDAKLLARMRTLLVTARTPWKGAPRPYDKVLLPAVAKPAHTGRLTYRFYKGHWPWVPDFNELKPAWMGHVDRLGLPWNRYQGDNAFGVAITGFFKVPRNGRYVFKVEDDSGVELWVHDDLVIDDDYLHSVAAKKGTVLLKAGWHPIRIAYRHDPSEPKAALSIQIRGPHWRLVHLAADKLAYGPYKNAPVR
jgi:arylsulfatase A-like enzyme